MDSSDEEVGANEVDYFDADEINDLSVDPTLSDREYVKRFTEKVERIFNSERGRDEAKKQNLSDVKSTQIDNSIIIQKPLLEEKELRDINKTQTMVYGNVKAVIPLMRERLMVELDD